MEFKITRAKSNGSYEGEIDGDIPAAFYDVAGYKNDGLCIEFDGEFDVEYDDDIIMCQITSIKCSTTGKDLTRIVDLEVLERQLDEDYELQGDLQADRIADAMDAAEYYD
jgi:hypothetical protein